jgi:hypothetical protein
MADSLEKDLEKIRKAKTTPPPLDKRAPPDINEQKRESTVSMPEQPTEGPTTENAPD